MREVPIGKYPIAKPKRRAFQIPTPPDEIRLPCLLLTAGARGSGKTLSVFSKLLHLRQQGLCHRCFIISPTLYSNKPVIEMLGEAIAPEDAYEHPGKEAVNDILAKMEEEADAHEDYLRKKKRYAALMKLLASDVNVNRIDPTFLLEASDEGLLDGPPKSRYGTDTPCFHLICDDCQSSQMFSLSPKNPFLNCVIRHRHVGRGLGLSIYLCVQNYSAGGGGVPKSIRDNCTVLCLFKMKSKSVIQKIIEEVANDVPEEQFMQAYERAVAEPHSFLCVDFFPSSPDKRFRQQWDKFLVLEGIGSDGDPTHTHPAPGAGAARPGVSDQLPVGAIPKT